MGGLKTEPHGGGKGNGFYIFFIIVFLVGRFEFLSVWDRPRSAAV